MEDDLQKERKIVEAQCLLAERIYEKECRKVEELRQDLNGAEQRLQERKEVLDQARHMLTLITPHIVEEQGNRVTDSANSVNDSASPSSQNTTRGRKRPAENYNADIVSVASSDDTFNDQEWTEGEEDPEERRIIQELPVYIRSRFLEIGFAKHPAGGGLWCPVLFLSPFDILPGNVRDMWMKHYESFLAGKKILNQRNMIHLVLWYGEYYQDQMLGFVSHKNTLTFEQGRSKNYDRLPGKILRKQKENTKLSAPEKQLIDGLVEAKRAIKLPKAERYSRTPNEEAEIWSDVSAFCYW